MTQNVEAPHVPRGTCIVWFCIIVLTDTQRHIPTKRHRAIDLYFSYIDTSVPFISGLFEGREREKTLDSTQGGLVCKRDGERASERERKRVREKE